MFPQINHVDVQKAMELAEELLSPYKEDLRYHTLQLEASRRHLLAAKALTSLIKRSESRSKALKDCIDASTYINEQLKNIDLEQCERFISTLEYRVSAYNRRIQTCKDAIKVLNKDIADFKTILATPFGNMYTYLSYIDGPGWAFYSYRPEKWLARWATPPKTTWDTGENFRSDGFPYPTHW
ncbi:hypothetical protein [Pseudomonas sp. S2_H01]